MVAEVEEVMKLIRRDGSIHKILLEIYTSLQNHNGEL